MNQTVPIATEGAVDLGDFAGATQHPLMQIPFNVILNGRSYTGSGLSMVMAYAKGPSAPQLEGQRRLVMLEFNFGGYTVNLPVETQVEAVSSETGLLTLRFTDPTGPHLPQLRYILNAFVDGELTALDGVVHATGQGACAKRNARAKRSAGAVLGKAVNTFAVLAASAALGLVILNGVYSRFFVTEATGVSMVAAGGMPLRAVSAGQIEFLNKEAAKGQPLFAIRATSGDIITVAMPCDCVAGATRLDVGSTVLAGDSVVTVAQADTRPVVRTAFNAAALNALAGGATASIILPDGREIETDYASATVTSEPGGAADVSEVTLAPEAGLVAADIGSPVRVRVETAQGGLFGAFHSFNAWTRATAAKAI